MVHPRESGQLTTHKQKNPFAEKPWLFEQQYSIIFKNNSKNRIVLGFTAAVNRLPEDSL